MKKYNKSNERYDNKPDDKKYTKFNKRKRYEPKGGTQSCSVRLRSGESVDQLIKRFKRVVEASGILREVKEREYYMSPRQKARDKKKKALKRLRKRERAVERYGKED